MNSPLIFPFLSKVYSFLVFLYTMLNFKCNAVHAGVCAYFSSSAWNFRLYFFLTVCLNIQRIDTDGGFDSSYSYIGSRIYSKKYYGSIVDPLSSFPIANYIYILPPRRWTFSYSVIHLYLWYFALFFIKETIIY